MATIPAIVLAAGGKKDKLALAEGVADKAMLPVGGRPMIDWVLEALAAAQRVGEVTVVADEGSPLTEYLAGRVNVAIPQGSSFLDSIEAGMAGYADQPRVLVCTGDIPLATGDHIDEFLGRCELEPRAELCYSMIRADVCEQQLPGGRRTTVKLREGVFTGGNIVTMAPAFLVREKQRFAEVFALRKSPLKLCRLLGWGFVIRLVLGLIHPTSGHAEVCGHRVPGELRGALRHVAGFVDDPTFYPLMSARGNLKLLGSMTGPVSEERVDEVLEIAGLLDRAESRVGGFSHGMKQRLGIAQALLHSPELIVLDEPTSGLDPRGMKDVRELIRDLGRTGTTVFLSSHLLHEVEQVCNRAVIIDRGRVVVQGDVSTLRPQNDAVKVLTDDQGKAAEVLRGQFGAGGVSEDEGYLIVQAGEDTVPEMVRRLVADGRDVRAVVPAPEQGLEDFFLELTGAEDAGPAPRRRRGVARLLGRSR